MVKAITDFLSSFFELVHSWVVPIVPEKGIAYGLAIILFTIIIKTILMPLNAKQIKSTMKMQEIQPLMAKIKEKYKNDPQKQNEETMKLYKEKGASPFAGCLPLLIQYPILIALYGVYRNLPGIQGVPFLYIKDLSQPDHLYILPVLSVLSMYLSTKVLSPKTDASNPQAGSMGMMNIIMSVMIGVMSIGLPSALVLYWVTSNIIGVVQTLVLRKYYAKKDDEKKEAVITEVTENKTSNRNSVKKISQEAASQLSVDLDKGEKDKKNK